MKLLLDESVPKRLASSFPASFTLRRVQEMGWAGTGNGLLLSLAANEGFEAMITVDRGIEHQQNLEALPIPVVIMLASRSRLTELQPLVPAAVDVLSEICKDAFIGSPGEPASISIAAMSQSALLGMAAVVRSVRPPISRRASGQAAARRRREALEE